MSTHYFENGSVHLKVKLEIPVTITSALMFRLVGLEMGLMLICLFINNPEAQVHSFIRRSILKHAAQHCFWFDLRYAGCGLGGFSSSKFILTIQEYLRRRVETWRLSRGLGRANRRIHPVLE